MITYGKIVLTLYIVANIIGWIVIILKEEKYVKQ